MSLADYADYADYANVSSAGSRLTSVARAVGLSPALLLKNNEPAFRSNGWPPEDLIGDDGITATQTWDDDTSIAATATTAPALDRGWEQPFSTLVVLAQHLTRPDWHLGVNDDVLGAVLKEGNAKQTDAELPPAVLSELDELALLIEYRPGVLGEALIQANTALPYLTGVLNFKASTHPYTYLIAATAERVGEMLAMYWKSRYNRPRPSRVRPKLLPPIDVPGHASFPSGHATQSYLVALCLGDVMPPAASQSLDDAKAEIKSLSAVKDDTGKVIWEWNWQQGPLFRMAERVARNREVLGLHYPSDTRAGQIIAASAYGALKLTFAGFTPKNGGPSLLNLARDEWGLQPVIWPPLHIIPGSP